MRLLALAAVVSVLFSPLALVAAEEDESPVSVIEATLEESNDELYIDLDTVAEVPNGGEHDDFDNAQAHQEDKNGSSSSAPSAHKRLWGGGHSEQPKTGPVSPQVPPTESSDATNNVSQQPLSFVKIPKGPHSPPEGFVISARVYIDPKDGLAHLDEENKITLPYWDCGVTGSTTSPIPVKDAAFRHSLTPTTPWTGTDGKHPLLAVALTPIIIETNSGESKAIQPGQVFLLEDVLMEGHRLLPAQHHELQVLFLTLPQTHYHPGKDRVSLLVPSSKRKTAHPCSSSDIVANRSNRVALFTATNVRRGLLGVIGLSLSGIVVDFLGRTAPLWLAVGVGGTFLVVAGTTLTILAGERALTSIEIMYEHQRLAKQSNAKKVGDISNETRESTANTN